MHPNGFLLAAAVVLMALALPLALRWVGPNSLYGVRTPRTVQDPARWYEANAFAGRLLGAIGGLGVLLSLAGPGLSRIRPGLEMALFLGVFLVGLVVVAVRGFFA